MNCLYGLILQFFKSKRNTYFAMVSVRSFLKSDFLKNAGMLFGSSSITQVLMLVAVVPILSRIYTVEQHGDITTFMSIMAIGASFYTLKYDQAIMVEEDREKAKALVKLSSLINLFFFVTTSVLLWIFKLPVSRYFGFDTIPSWLFLVPIGIFLTAKVDILLVWWNREKKYRKLSLNRIVTFVGSSGYKILHGWFKFKGPNGLILGHTIGQAVSVLLFTPKTILSNLSINVTELKGLWSKYKSFRNWAMPGSLVNVIGSHIPVFLILFFFDRETNGFYGNAMKLTYIPLTAVSYAISQVLFERLARIKNDKQESIKLSYNILYFLFFLALVPVTAMVVWGDIITPFILGEGWETAGVMAQVLVLFCFAMYLSSPFAVAFEVYNRLRLQFVFTGLFAALTGTALFITLRYTNDILMGLMAFSIVGILVRLAMLISCFRLIGKTPIFKILAGIFIIAVTLVIGFALRYWIF
jgi:O-antigen/teichoic acid export membrane protein